MKDLIWTIIGIWFVYNIIRFINNKKNKNSNTHSPSFPSSPEIKTDLSNKGEYIDFEEIKE